MIQIQATEIIRMHVVRSADPGGPIRTLRVYMSNGFLYYEFMLSDVIYSMRDLIRDDHKLPVTGEGHKNMLSLAAKIEDIIRDYTSYRVINVFEGDSILYPWGQ